jgi:para-nitrobenzyl esterase
MGFLNIAQLKTGADAASDSGNFALLDIIQALKFINKNIANFGGNRDNVTLMGNRPAQSTPGQSLPLH